MKNKGFTLIELMIVIIIIGILASVAVPIFHDKQKGRSQAVTVVTPEDIQPTPAAPKAVATGLVEQCLNTYVYVSNGTSLTQKLDQDSHPARCP